MGQTAMEPAPEAEFDRRVTKALNTQKEKLDGEYQAALAEAKKEAEKLARMNADQKKQYEAEKTEQLIIYACGVSGYEAPITFLVACIVAI